MLKSALVSVLLLMIIIIGEVKNDPVLFQEGFIKFSRYGRRQLFTNIEHIDNKISAVADKQLVFVKSKWLPVLHPESIRNLKSLEQIVLVKCRIKTIKKNAFYNLPNLTTINLHDNEISEIKSGIFNKLSVQLITLQRNGIKTIESDAFDNMPNLYKIRLNANRLKAWDAKWFTNSPKLTEVYFRRNHLEHLPQSAFINLKPPDAKLYLSKNKLGKINVGSFYGLRQISQLYLDRNNISEISNNAFPDLMQVDVLYMARNRIKNINENAFPAISKIGFLDLSNNQLLCLPYKLVIAANVTSLQKNNGTCQCVWDYQVRLGKENRNNEMTYDQECE